MQQDDDPNSKSATERLKRIKVLQLSKVQSSASFKCCVKKLYANERLQTSVNLWFPIRKGHLVHNEL